IDIVIANIADVFRRHGFAIKGKIKLHRWAFNVSCCALCTWGMHMLYQSTWRLSFIYPLNVIVPLFSVAIVWFFINTGTLSMVLSLLMNRSFWSVWREGVALYLLNFLGSAAAAGLISVFYERVGFAIFFFSVPLVAILYQLYHFYIDKYIQAQNHITEL